MQYSVHVDFVLYQFECCLLVFDNVPIYDKLMSVTVPMQCSTVRRVELEIATTCIYMNLLLGSADLQSLQMRRSKILLLLYLCHLKNRCNIQICTHGSLYSSCSFSVLVLFPFLTRKQYFFRPQGTLVDANIKVNRYTLHIIGKLSCS